MQENIDLTPEEEDALYAVFASVDWEHIPGPFDALTKELKLREVTTAELSQILGITDRRISQLWLAGDIPEPRNDGKRHWFPLLDTVHAYISFLKDRTNRL